MTFQKLRKESRVRLLSCDITMPPTALDECCFSMPERRYFVMTLVLIVILYGIGDALDITFPGWMFTVLWILFSVKAALTLFSTAVKLADRSKGLSGDRK